MLAALALLLAVPVSGQINVRAPAGDGASLILAFGDSKSVYNTYHRDLDTYGRANKVMTFDLASGGATVASRKASIDADLALRTQTFKAVLINLGANDVGSMPAQATFETNLAYILDALHAKWPNARILVASSWRRGFDSESATLKSWEANVLATRGPWAVAGPDEAVFIKQADDGASCTSDGTHWNSTCYQAEALEWAQDLGYQP